MLAVQHGAELFQNDYNALVSESRQVSMDKSPNYVMIYGFSVSFSVLLFLIIGISYLCFRVNKLTVLIVTLSLRSRLAEAYPQFIFPMTSTPSPSDCQYPSTMHFYLLIVILLSIILFLITYVILRCMRARK